MSQQTAGDQDAEQAAGQPVVSGEVVTGGEVTTAGAQGTKPYVTPSPFRRAWSRLLKDKAAVVSLVFLLLLVAVALLAPVLAPHDPNELGIGEPYAKPAAEHWFGTDDLGRDTFSRLLFGARVSLRFGIQVVAFALIVSIPVGLFAGYKGGIVDNAIMRIMDALSSIPALVLALSLVGVLGPSINNAILAIAIVVCPGFIRQIRAQALAVREETFIEASNSLGTPQRRILFKRVLPNVASPLIVAASLALGGALVAEAGLSLLGFGIQPPDASWGNMLQRGRVAINQHPWQVFTPGIALALTILAFNTLGDGLRDALGLGLPKGKVAIKGRLGLTSVREEARKAPKQQPAAENLLEVHNLSVEFINEQGALTVVQDVSFDLKQGEILGLVGESGSGKTVTSLAIMRLIPSPPGRIASGSVWFDGKDMLSLSLPELRKMRGNDMAMVFQDPMTSLNPAFTIGDQLVEAIRLHQPLKKDAAKTRAVELLDLVGIPDPQRRMKDYPHQFSGGMRQRALLAVALSCEPKLLIADEPTTALDVTVQAQILDLLRKLQREMGMSVIFVTHDLGVVADLCDRVAVMYAGQIVEQASVSELFAHPQHPYTEGLMGAIPQLAANAGRLDSIPGVVPNAANMPTGCRFHPRCPYAVDACLEPVSLEPTGDGRLARCIRVTELDLRGAR
jgi:peptide/nickel transport system permease protein